jgi:[ribosomal protein S18]-alanine N-acetyltransferase
VRMILRDMQLSDLDQVTYIERASFPTPWSTLAYVYEIKQNPMMFMGVVEAPGQPVTVAHQPFDRLQILKRTFQRRKKPPDAIVAYGGVWVKRGEAHISTIASHQDYRGRGLGELMLVALLARGIQAGATFSALEVRLSNTVAQTLYHKYGYVKSEIIPRYYHDNAEDAYLMKIPALDDTYRTQFRTHVAALARRLKFEDQFSGLQLEQGTL